MGARLEEGIQQSRARSLRRHAFWTCCGILLPLAIASGTTLTVFLTHVALPDPRMRGALAWRVAVVCWAWAVPGVWLIARFESRWLSRRVQEPFAIMIQRCRAIRDARVPVRFIRERLVGEPADLALAMEEVFTHFTQTVTRQHQFLADAAHELRTPLTAQSLIAENTLSRKASTAELREAVCSMLEEAKHMRRLIDSLLELTRVSAGGMTERTPVRGAAPLNLRRLAHNCVESLQILAEEKQQTLALIGTTDVWVDADLTMVRQALLNVIHNAIEHCPASACIEVETFESSSLEGAIAVIDNGPGIPVEQQPQVFERFYRGPTGSRRRGAGLGLGLAIARAVLQSQGGNIQLTSGPGIGCRFTLTLPLAQRSEPLEQASPAAVTDAFGAQTRHKTRPYYQADTGGELAI